MNDNQIIQDFSLPATSGLTFTLSQASKPLVIYFYPKDSTPGCTNEAISFRDLYAEFQKAGVEIVGLSRDSIKSHENFKAKHELPFELLSDKDETVCNLFQVMKEKNMYGKKVHGIERSTFLIGPDNHILHSWRGVKVPGHAEEVLAFIKA